MNSFGSEGGGFGIYIYICSWDFSAALVASLLFEHPSIWGELGGKLLRSHAT